MLVTGTAFNSNVGSTWLGLEKQAFIIRQNTFSGWNLTIMILYKKKGV